MVRNDFCAFILSHGRANRVFTYKTLAECGYTGKVVVVIDDEDEQADEYKRIFGEENVIVFCKKEQYEKCDSGDISGDMRVILYARNACFDIAKEMGIKYFIELDDDYKVFEFRYERNNRMFSKKCKNLDYIIEKYIEFLQAAKCDSVAFAQGGDYIGGKGSNIVKCEMLRKAMNSFIFRADSDIRFFGRINEDVNMYTRLGSVGRLFLTPMQIMLVQETTQKSAGGMTDVYLDSGTYIKSFFTVMYMPSAVKVGMMGTSHRRLHHRIDCNKCVPKILSEKTLRR